MSSLYPACHSLLYPRVNCCRYILRQKWVLYLSIRADNRGHSCCTEPLHFSIGHYIHFPISDKGLSREEERNNGNGWEAWWSHSLPIKQCDCPGESQATLLVPLHHHFLHTHTTVRSPAVPCSILKTSACQQIWWFFREREWFQGNIPVITVLLYIQPAFTFTGLYARDLLRQMMSL